MFRLFRGTGAAVAQCVKRWSTDTEVPGSSPVWGEDLFNR